MALGPQDSSILVPCTLQPTNTYDVAVSAPTYDTASHALILFLCNDADLTVYEVLLRHRLVLTRSAVALLEETLGAWEPEVHAVNRCVW